MPTRVLQGLIAGLLVLVLTTAVVVAGGPTGASPSGVRASSATSTTVITRGDELGNSLPRPNSGTPPQASGDRGGSAQVTLFVLLVAGTAFIGVMIVREVRKGRRRLEAEQHR